MGAKRYIRCFSRREGEGLRAKYSHVEEASLDILGKMLKFNPRRRSTVLQLLDHALFTEIKDTSRETTSERRISLDFEKEPDLDEGLLRRYFTQEIRNSDHEVPKAGSLFARRAKPRPAQSGAAANKITFG